MEREGRQKRLPNPPPPSPLSDVDVAAPAPAPASAPENAAGNNSRRHSAPSRGRRRGEKGRRRATHPRTHIRTRCASPVVSVCLFAPPALRPAIPSPHRLSPRFASSVPILASPQRQSEGGADAWPTSPPGCLPPPRAGRSATAGDRCVPASRTTAPTREPPARRIPLYPHTCLRVGGATMFRVEKKGGGREGGLGLGWTLHRCEDPSLLELAALHRCSGRRRGRGKVSGRCSTRIPTSALDSRGHETQTQSRAGPRRVSTCHVTKQDRKAQAQEGRQKGTGASGGGGDGDGMSGVDGEKQKQKQKDDDAVNVDPGCVSCLRGRRMAHDGGFRLRGERSEGREEGVGEGRNITYWLRLAAERSEARADSPARGQGRPVGGRYCFHSRCEFALGSSPSTASQKRGYPRGMSCSCWVAPWCEEDAEVKGTSNLRRPHWAAVHPNIPAASGRQARIAHDHLCDRGEEAQGTAVMSEAVTQWLASRNAGDGVLDGQRVGRTERWVRLLENSAGASFSFGVPDGGLRLSPGGSEVIHERWREPTMPKTGRKDRPFSLGSVAKEFDRSTTRLRRKVHLELSKAKTCSETSEISRSRYTSARIVDKPHISEQCRPLRPYSPIFKWSAPAKDCRAKFVSGEIPIETSKDSQQHTARTYGICNTSKRTIPQVHNVAQRPASPWAASQAKRHNAAPWVHTKSENRDRRYRVAVENAVTLDPPAAHKEGRKERSECAGRVEEQARYSREGFKFQPPGRIARARRRKARRTRLRPMGLTKRGMPQHQGAIRAHGGLASGVGVGRCVGGRDERVRGRTSGSVGCVGTLAETRSMGSAEAEHPGITACSRSSSQSSLRQSLPTIDKSRSIPTLRHASHRLSLSDTISTLPCQPIVLIDVINTMTWELQLTFNLLESPVRRPSPSLISVHPPVSCPGLHGLALIRPFIVTCGGGAHNPSIPSTNADSRIAPSPVLHSLARRSSPRRPSLRIASMSSRPVFVARRTGNLHPKLPLLPCRYSHDVRMVHTDMHTHTLAAMYTWGRGAICTTAIATATVRFPPSCPPVTRRTPLPSNFAAAIHATACRNPAAVTSHQSASVCGPAQRATRCRIRFTSTALNIPTPDVVARYTACAPSEVMITSHRSKRLIGRYNQPRQQNRGKDWRDRRGRHGIFGKSRQAAGLHILDGGRTQCWMLHCPEALIPGGIFHGSLAAPLTRFPSFQAGPRVQSRKPRPPEMRREPTLFSRTHPPNSLPMRCNCALHMHPEPPRELPCGMGLPADLMSAASQTRSPACLPACLLACLPAREQDYLVMDTVAPIPPSEHGTSVGPDVHRGSADVREDTRTSPARPPLSPYLNYPYPNYQYQYLSQPASCRKLRGAPPLSRAYAPYRRYAMNPTRTLDRSRLGPDCGGATPDPTTTPTSSADTDAETGQNTHTTDQNKPKDLHNPKRASLISTRPHPRPRRVVPASSHPRAAAICPPSIRHPSIYPHESFLVSRLASLNEEQSTHSMPSPHDLHQAPCGARRSGFADVIAMCTGARTRTRACQCECHTALAARSNFELSRVCAEAGLPTPCTQPQPPLATPQGASYLLSLRGRWRCLGRDDPAYSLDSESVYTYTYTDTLTVPQAGDKRPASPCGLDWPRTATARCGRPRLRLLRYPVYEYEREFEYEYGGFGMGAGTGTRPIVWHKPLGQASNFQTVMDMYSGHPIYKYASSSSPMLLLGLWILHSRTSIKEDRRDSEKRESGARRSPYHPPPSGSESEGAGAVTQISSAGKKCSAKPRKTREDGDGDGNRTTEIPASRQCARPTPAPSPTVMMLCSPANLDPRNCYHPPPARRMGPGDVQDRMIVTFIDIVLKATSGVDIGIRTADPDPSDPEPPNPHNRRRFHNPTPGPRASGLGEQHSTSTSASLRATPRISRQPEDTWHGRIEHLSRSCLRSRSRAHANTTFSSTCGDAPVATSITCPTPRSRHYPPALRTLVSFRPLISLTTTFRIYPPHYFEIRVKSWQADIQELAIPICPGTPLRSYLMRASPCREGVRDSSTYSNPIHAFASTPPNEQAEYLVARATKTGPPRHGHRLPATCQVPSAVSQKVALRRVFGVDMRLSGWTGIIDNAGRQRLRLLNYGN
ncbi:hypothetical protein V8D89_008561 [Ganoderma adspersum]